MTRTGGGDSSSLNHASVPFVTSGTPREMYCCLIIGILLPQKREDAAPEFVRFGKLA